VIGQHQRSLVEERGLDYPILSNDNGFPGEWGQRTMMTRFRPDGEEPPKDEFALVKKPAFTLMELLSLMGDTAVRIEGIEDPLGDIGALGTVDDDGRIAVCIYNSSDAVNQSGEDQIELEIAGVPMKNGRMVHYRIDRDHGDVFDLWQKAFQTGIRMAIRSGGLVKEIRKNQEPQHLLEPTDFDAENGTVSLNFVLPRPGVSVILLCPEPSGDPAVPQGIGAQTYKGMTDEEEVLIWWEPSNSPYIRTYEVAFSEEQGGDYSRANEADLLSSAYLHLRKTRSGRGSYRIRAIDYWGRAGEWSAPIVV
jgi:L-iduronidase